MWPFGKSIVDRVKDGIKEYPPVAGLPLVVNEQGGTVSFTGEVPSQAHVNLLRAVAEGISGVKQVDTSGLTVQQAEASSEPEQAAPDGAMADGGQAEQAAPATHEVQASAPVSHASVQAQIENASKLAKAALHAIRGNGELADNPIDVLQKGSSIILRGAVDSEHELHLAAQLVRDVPGVGAVDAGGVKVIGGVKELVKETQDKDVVYTVKSGDNLSAIALKYFGDPGKYRDIAHYNNISNPDHIEVGQKIRIPSA